MRIYALYAKNLLFFVVITLLPKLSSGQVLASFTGARPPEDRSAQNANIRPLQRVLSEISTRYKVTFNYDPDLIEDQMVDVAGVKLNQPNVEITLTQLLRQLNLEFEKLERNDYVIFQGRKSKQGSGPESRLDLIDEIPLRNQSSSLNHSVNLSSPRRILEFTVTGKVTAQDSGEPQIGVSVNLKGTTTGTVTDSDGNYKITLPDGTGTLVFSFIGMITEEIVIGNRSQIDVQLKADVKTLGEVIVVGYGTQSKRNVTAAVSSIDAEELRRSASTTTAGALAGKLPGVTTRATDARPGRGIDLQIRNMGNPLFVVDGVPYGGDVSRDWLGISRISGNDVFNTIGMENIASISVLKDASAAIYGVRAANGVVLITTKNGNFNDKVKVNVNGYYGWQNLTRFPKLANAGQYVRGQVEAWQNAGDPNAPVPYTSEELAKWEAGTEPGYQSYDYYDLVLRKNVPQYNYNASVDGGSKNSKYFISIGKTYQEALMKDFDYNRSNLQLNLTSKVFGGLTLGTQTSAKLEDIRDVGLEGGDGYFSSMLALFSNLPTVGPYANGNPDYPRNVPNRPDLNPALFSRETVGYKDTHYKAINVNLFAEYKFDFGLSAKYTYSHNYTNALFDGFQYTYDLYNFNATSNEYVKQGGKDARWRFQTKIQSISRYHNFQLNYEKTFGANHSLSAIVAYERNDWDRELSWLGAAPTNNYIPLNNLGDLTGYGDEWTYQARAGYLTRINYSYKDKYLLELIGRYDASYLYKPESRWGFFPGVTAGWRISDEAFFEGLRNTVSNLKVRVSVGQNGQEAGVVPFGYLPGYSFGRRTDNSVVPGSVLDGEYITGMVPNAPPITTLSWETHTTYNAGMDASFFKNKLSLQADVFRKVMSGIPAPRYDVLLPSEVGYALPNENLNKNEHRGAEGMISYNGQLADLEYTISGNVTYSRFRHLEIYKPRFGNSYDEWRRSPVDRWGGLNWGYQAVGQFQSVEEIRNHPIDNDGQNNRTQLPGDIIYKDVNDDGVINWLDETPIGYPEGWTPMLAYGSSIGLKWNGFDMNLNFAGGGMQSWLQNYELRNAFHAGGNSPAYLLTDRWHRADPYNPDSEWIPGRYPAIRRGTTLNNGRKSDFWLHSVRYLRLNYAEIGYNLPKDFIKRAYLSNARFYVAGSNLFSLDNVKQFGIDPEINAQAAVVYPQQRTIMVGFNLSF